MPKFGFFIKKVVQKGQSQKLQKMGQVGKQVGEAPGRWYIQKSFKYTIHQGFTHLLTNLSLFGDFGTVLLDHLLVIV